MREYFFVNLKKAWYEMLQPPWRSSGTDNDKRRHWWAWLTGWAWAVSGLFLGSLIASSFVPYPIVVDVRYQDAIIIGAAVIVGFVVQLFGWFVVIGTFFVGDMSKENISTYPMTAILGWSLLLLPYAGVAYGLYRYFTWAGAAQGLVNTGFVGGLLVKTFLIPLVIGVGRSTAMKRLIDWLRGGKDKGTH